MTADDQPKPTIWFIDQELELGIFNDVKIVDNPAEHDHWTFNGMQVVERSEYDQVIRDAKALAAALELCRDHAFDYITYIVGPKAITSKTFRIFTESVERADKALTPERRKKYL
jgi:hypothetical protein